ncbi:MAG TPA: substrate-binding domain-containing protein [Gemmataceae bacterium]|nr:substrate-binding domain-containing protein [Gemmataceae bacterium]
MRKLRPLPAVLFFALLVCVAVIPACTTGTSTDPGKPFVAFISNNGFEFWTIAERGTEAAAQKYDVRVEFKKPSGGGTSEEQRRFMEDLMTKGVKAIAISPNDAENQVSFFKGVNEKIPLLTVDSDVPDPSVRRCYLGTDNVAAGRAVGKILKQTLPQGGKIMIFVGKLDVQNAVERRKGVVTELAGGEDKCKAELEQMTNGKYPVKFGNYELIDTRTDGGSDAVCREKVDDALVKYPNLNCMIGLWAYNPPAMLAGVKAAKDRRGKVVLIGFDENEETLQGIRDGDIVATVVQDPYNFGYQAVRIMAALARGDDSPLKDKDMNAQKQLFVKHRIVNKDGKTGPLLEGEQIEAVDPFAAKLKELKGK